VISWIRGAIAAVRRWVKGADTSLRSLVWSGGFAPSRCVCIPAWSSGGAESRTR
jgi:hypothetical protein